MATARQPKSRFSNPDTKYLGEEPLFDPELGTEYPKRNRDTIIALNWYNYFVSKKDLIPDMHDYARDVLKLKKTELISFKNGASSWATRTCGSLIRMAERGYVLTDAQKDNIRNDIMVAVLQGSKIKGVVATEVKGDPLPPVSIQDRIRLKVHATILEDIRGVEDRWTLGETNVTFDAYTRLKTHELPAMACSHAIPWVQNLVDLYSDAMNKNCDQAVEAYKHLSKVQLKERVKLLNKALDDIKRYQANSKTVRKVRAKKPVAATKQAAKIKFLKESPEFKLVSINPASIVGAMRLFVFNVKTRTLSEYVSSEPAGFGIKGTTLNGWDENGSRSTKLRKPEDLLPLILSKTVRQIDNAWKKLTTKDSSPNGRLNDDTILMRITNG
jgi:hypothetical protein